MGDSIERNAVKQNRYREVNERVAEVRRRFAAENEGTASELFEVFCECGHLAPCGQRVSVSGETYERIRSDPTTFVLVPGHEVTAVEEMIECGPGFLIARNIGRAAEIARAADPRRVVDASLGAKPARLVL